MTFFNDFNPGKPPRRSDDEVGMLGISMLIGEIIFLAILTHTGVPSDYNLDLIGLGGLLWLGASFAAILYNI